MRSRRIGITEAQDRKRKSLLRKLLGREYKREVIRRQGIRIGDLVAIVTPKGNQVEGLFHRITVIGYTTPIIYLNLYRPVDHNGNPPIILPNQYDPLSDLSESFTSNVNVVPVLKNRPQHDY